MKINKEEIQRAVMVLIMEAAKRHGKDMMDLAIAAGRSIDTIENWFNCDSRLPLTDYVQICNEAGVDPGKILTEVWSKHAVSLSRHV